MRDEVLDPEEVIEEAEPGPGLSYSDINGYGARVVAVDGLLEEIEEIVRLQDPWVVLRRLNALKIELKENAE